jgi:hypothetical protein
MEFPSSFASDTNNSFVVFLHALAPHSHSKNAAKNQKNALLSRSVVALLSLHPQFFNCEEDFSAFFEIGDSLLRNFGTRLFTRTPLCIQCFIEAT